MLKMNESWEPVLCWSEAVSTGRKVSYFSAFREEHVLSNSHGETGKCSGPRGQMNPDVRACSQGGVHLYSSCFSLFKSSVASFYSIFPGSLPLSSLFPSFVFCLCHSFGK